MDLHSRLYHFTRFLLVTLFRCRYGRRISTGRRQEGFRALCLTEQSSTGLFIVHVASRTRKCGVLAMRWADA
jgi:hypothetical protein